MVTTTDATRSLKRYVANALGPEWEVRLNSEEGAFRRPFCRVDVAGGATFGGGMSSSLAQEVSMSFALILYPKESSTPDEALMKAMACEEQVWQMLNVGTGYLSAPMNLTATKQSGGSLSGSQRYSVVAVNRYGKTNASAVSVSSVNGKVVLAWTAMPEATSYQVFRGPEGSERWMADTLNATYTDDGTVTPVVTTQLPSANTARIGGPMRVPMYDYDNVSLTEGATDATRPTGAFMRIVDPPTVNRLVDTHDDLMWVVTANIRMSWSRSSVVPSDAPLVTSFTTSEDVA